jgi:AraC family transcriptional regulator
MDPDWLAQVSDKKLGADILVARPEFSYSRFVRELSIDDAVRPLAIESAVAELLALAGRTLAPGERHGAPLWLRRARELLHESARGKPSLSSLARVAGVHEGHLTRAFRGYFGCSIGEYARGVRIRSAARALITSDRPISDIALEAGFYDQSHFHRVFRRALGCTPRTWRRRNGRRKADARIVQSFRLGG